MAIKTVSDVELLAAFSGGIIYSLAILHLEHC